MPWFCTKSRVKRVHRTEGARRDSDVFSVRSDPESTIRLLNIREMNSRGRTRRVLPKQSQLSKLRSCDSSTGARATLRFSPMIRERYRFAGAPDQKSSVVADSAILFL